MEEILRLEHLEKTFGTHQVLRDISFSVNKGDVISIIGSSGSGKSTMLRCVNLLEEPTGGKIIFEGKDIAGKELNLSQYRARVGMVFQQFNLFNNMNALENCVCPQLTVLHRKREEAEKIARDYLERVGMSAYCNARPAQLSGGQKQRVAIARTLSMNPDIILFDEPTSALDPDHLDVLLARQVVNVLRDAGDAHHVGLQQAVGDRSDLHRHRLNGVQQGQDFAADALVRRDGQVGCHIGPPRFL